MRYPKFGEVVDDRIEALGTTGRALASRLGKREGTVTAWRKGESRPEDEGLRALASALEVSIEALLADDANKSAGSPPTVAEVLRAAQVEQAKWLRRFSIRLLEAQLHQFRLDSSAMSLEELLESEAYIDQLDDEIKARRRGSDGGEAQAG